MIVNVKRFQAYDLALRRGLILERVHDLEVRLVNFVVVEVEHEVAYRKKDKTDGRQRHKHISSPPVRETFLLVRIS